MHQLDIDVALTHTGDGFTSGCAPRRYPGNGTDAGQEHLGSHSGTISPGLSEARTLPLIERPTLTQVPSGGPEGKIAPAMRAGFVTRCVTCAQLGSGAPDLRGGLMTDDEGAASRTQKPVTAAGRARLDSDTMRRWTVEVAEAVAASQERLAATLDRLADQRPEHASRLQADSETAKTYATRGRQWAEDHRRRWQRHDRAT